LKRIAGDTLPEYFESGLERRCDGRLSGQMKARTAGGRGKSRKICLFHGPSEHQDRGRYQQRYENERNQQDDPEIREAIHHFFSTWAVVF
jgi:hypothetical protein